MPKITSLDDLRRIKDTAKDQTAARSEGKSRIIIGLGTCGIAAGGRAIMQAVLEELDKRSIKDVSVETTGCIGMCQNEPLLDVIRGGDARITYGNVSVADVPTIIAEHLVNGRVVQAKVIGRAD